jgi:hypothetical protein
MTWVKPKFEIIDLCSEVTSEQRSMTSNVGFTHVMYDASRFGFT